MMYNDDGKKQADLDAELTVKHFLENGIEARVSTEDEDKIKHFDIVVDGKKIDLKRFNDFYCEITKLQNPQNEADQIWMIVNDEIHKTYLIDRKALVRVCAEILNPFELVDPDSWPIVNKEKDNNVTYKIGKSCGDKLAYFNLEMLREEDYEVIDMKWLDDQK